jgi:ABC-2 type transport system ATP-binding protein
MLLEIHGLTKTYRRGARANDGVDLALDAGEVHGLLGHNGAGKTTLVNQVVGLLRPDGGTIRLGGHDLVADPAEARRVCSIQPQAQVPIDGLTLDQAIELVGRMRGGRVSDVRARRDRLVDALDLAEWRAQDGKRLSGGVKRLVSFAMAAVVPGRLVVLDEPTNDVDPVRRRLLWEQVRALGDEGAAVLLVTHNVVEAERSVDRLSILDHGRVVETGTPAELKARVADDLRLELVLEPGVMPPALPAWVLHSVGAGQRHLVTLPTRAAAEAVVWAETLRGHGLVEEYRLGPATLEDVYVEIAGRADALENGQAAPGVSSAAPAAPSAPSGSPRRTAPSPVVVTAAQHGEMDRARAS